MPVGGVESNEKHYRESHLSNFLAKMPHGKAIAITLTKLERRALENLRTLLEERADEHASRVSGFVHRQRKVSRSDETYTLALLKLTAILLASDGLKNRQIADRIQMSAHTVGKWREEFLYILSMDDLPFERIKGYFHYNYLPVENVIATLEEHGDYTWWDKSFANLNIK